MSGSRYHLLSIRRGLARRRTQQPGLPDRPGASLTSGDVCGSSGANVNVHDHRRQPRWQPQLLLQLRRRLWAGRSAYQALRLRCVICDPPQLRWIRHFTLPRGVLLLPSGDSLIRQPVVNLLPCAACRPIVLRTNDELDALGFRPCRSVVAQPDAHAKGTPC